jgi:hemolysin activation/secretion protein
MECRDLQSLFALFLLFLSPLAIAGPPGAADAVELTEEIAQPDTDPELLPTEGEIGEGDEGEGVQGVTVEEGAPFEVPALIDRPLDIEEGPYLVVKEFNMIDAEDYPEHEVSVSEIKSTILDDLLKKQLERGFSIGELQEVADEVTRYYRTKGLILSTAVVPVQTITDGVVDIQVFIGRLGRVVTEGNKTYDLEILEKPFSKLIGQPVTQHEIESGKIG